MRYADKVLGIVLDRLKRENLYERSIIIVTSDHGVRVWGDLYHHIDLIAHVPLIFRGPGIKQGLYSWDVQHIDLVPTLLQLLGQPYRPSDYEGASALNPQRPFRSKTLYVEAENLGTQVFAFDAGAHSWKMIQNRPAAAAQDHALGSVLSATGFALQAESSFSAIQVFNDLLEARERRQDFLTIHLKRHFPKAVTDSQIQSLRENLKILETLPDRPTNNFRRAMAYFFLALSETQRIAGGKSVDLAATNQHWKHALENFRKAENLQAGLVQEVTGILQKADANRDGSLNSGELTSIITSRTRK